MGGFGRGALRARSCARLKPRRNLPQDAGIKFSAVKAKETDR